MSRNKICFGRNLRTLRNSCGMTQQQLADEIHVTRQTLSNWENGIEKPDIEIFDNICYFFDARPDDMLRGTVRNETFITVYERDKEFFYWEMEHFIENISDRGFYTIINEDLQNFFPIINSDFEHIMVMILVLKKQGYQLADVFSNGFSVFIRRAEEAENFKRDVYRIFDSFIHGYDEFVEDKMTYISDITGEAACKVINEVMEEILGKGKEQFKYYWIDELENLRGYAMTEEECNEQAAYQECEVYEIIPIV